MATETKEDRPSRVTVVDDDIVVPIRIGKRTRLISRKSIAERMRDNYEDRHGTGRDFDDEDEDLIMAETKVDNTACPHCFGERSLGDCQVTQRLHAASLEATQKRLEKLEEALNGLCPRLIAGWGGCWCLVSPNSAAAEDHETKCVTAHAAMQLSEEGS